MSLHAERMQRFIAAGLYFVTSEPLSKGRSTLEVMRAALRGGVRLVQLREKELHARDLAALARSARELTNEFGALLLVNDRLDIALACGADGVHLGQEDLPVADARRLAPELIVGASSHSAAEAAEAEKQGASYVNIGPLFPTSTKAWGREFLGVEGLRAIAPHVRIPFTVMGGIKAAHLPDLAAAGARTVAVVTAITAAEDPERSAAEMLAALRAAGNRASIGSVSGRMGCQKGA